MESGNRLQEVGHVKLCDHGAAVFPETRFVEDDADLAPRYDVVLAAGALQYAPDWKTLLGRLAGATGRWLYVARVPVASHADSFVVIQRPHVHGYDTEYLGWVLNRGDLLGAAGLPLAREFLLDARFSAVGAPEDPVEHRSFLFNR